MRIDRYVCDRCEKDLTNPPFRFTGKPRSGVYAMTPWVDTDNFRALARHPEFAVSIRIRRKGGIRGVILEYSEEADLCRNCFRDLVRDALLSEIDARGD